MERQIARPAPVSLFNCTCWERLRSASTDPAANLAWEETLFRRSAGPDGVLFIYSNAPCVVIGRNQNPWRECDLRWVRQNGLDLRRRISGGGTVAQDLGGINVAMIVPREAYCPDRFATWLARALAPLVPGIRACERRSLWCGGRKIAGTASTMAGARALMHACLLVNSDLAQIRRALRIPPVDITWRGIESVPSPIANISDVVPDVSIDDVIQALEAAVPRGAVSARVEAAQPPARLIATAYTQQLSPDWRYGRTPAFEHRVAVGATGILTVTVEHARVVRADLDGQQMPVLAGVPYDARSLLTACSASRSPLLSEAVAAAIRTAVP